MNAPTPPTEAKDAEPVAGIGHNNPPAYDKAAFEELTKNVVAFMKVTKQWLDLEKITTDQQASQLTDQISGLRKLHKEVDEARRAAKKPHDDAGQDVQDAFLPVLAKIKAAADKLKKPLAAFAAAKAEAERIAKQKAAEEAKRQAEAAEKARQEAEANNDVAAEQEAIEAAKEAQKAQKVAARPVETKTKSASGAGRTMGLRTQKVAEVRNIRHLFMHYQDHPKVVELLTALATADVRAKDYDHENDPIPGINVREKQVIA